MDSCFELVWLLSVLCMHAYSCSSTYTYTRQLVSVEDIALVHSPNELIYTLKLEYLKNTYPAASLVVCGRRNGYTVHIGMLSVI